MTRCLLLSMDDWRARHAPAIPSVRTVHLQVGDFTCVEPEQLQLTWGVAVRDGWLAGARLAIETIPLVGRCLSCNRTYAPNPEAAYRSPCCDQPLEEIVSGRELRIRSVDYSLPDPPAATDGGTSSSSEDAPARAWSSRLASADPASMDSTSRDPASRVPVSIESTTEGSASTLLVSTGSAIFSAASANSACQSHPAF